MSEEQSVAPLSARCAVAFQWAQALALFAFSLVGLLLAHSGGRGQTPRQMLGRTALLILLPTWFTIAVAALLGIQRRVTWWLAIAWNLLTLIGAAFAVGAYFRLRIWQLLLLPLLTLLSLLLPATRRHYQSFQEGLLDSASSSPLT